MEMLRKKSVLLTGYLEHLVLHYFGKNSPHRQKDTWCDIITPEDPDQRGCQLSLMFSIDIRIVHQNLLKRGVVVSNARLYRFAISVFRLKLYYFCSKLL